MTALPKDIDELFKARGAEAVRDAINNAVPVTTPAMEQIAATLAAVRFDFQNPPPHSPPIFKLGDAKIATAGNLVGIQAQAKAGKTALIGAMLAATMEPTGDVLGIVSENPRGLALVHFDTEQSRADHHAVIRRGLFRAGRAEPPPWLRSYCVTGLTLKDRKAALAFELERANAECGGIHSVFLDGIADFATDPNDPGEAFALLDELHQTAIRYNAPILCVLHENPGSESGKTRGHLGSQLERKAETNLRLAKDGDGITVIFAERARHAHIPKEQGPRFKWCDEAGMHVSCASHSASKGSAKRERLAELASEIFQGTPDAVGMTWEQLHQRIEEIEGVGRSGARKKYDALREAKVIRKSGERYRMA
jgi:hypothetical protein